MPTTTRGRRSSATTTRRFSGPAMNARRHAAPQRRGVAGGWLQRRQPPKQSALQRMMSRMPGRKGAGGLAAIAGAAGLAFKNRGRLASMMRRSDNAPKG